MDPPGAGCAGHVTGSRRRRKIGMTDWQDFENADCRAFVANARLTLAGTCHARPPNPSGQRLSTSEGTTEVSHWELFGVCARFPFCRDSAHGQITLEPNSFRQCARCRVALRPGRVRSDGDSRAGRSAPARLAADVARPRMALPLVCRAGDGGMGPDSRRDRTPRAVAAQPSPHRVRPT